jgi:isopropylmalate/homocitrate/citramalate synthase
MQEEITKFSELSEKIDSGLEELYKFLPEESRNLNGVLESLQLLDEYLKIDDPCSLAEKLEKYENYKSFGRVEEIQKVFETFEKYTKLGTPEHIESALAMAEEHIKEMKKAKEDAEVQEVANTFGVSEEKVRKLLEKMTKEEVIAFLEDFNQSLIEKDIKNRYTKSSEEKIQESSKEKSDFKSKALNDRLSRLSENFK